MKILIINSWSSSLKFQLFDILNDNILIEWIIEKISLKDSFIKYEVNNNKNKILEEIKDHNEWLNLVLDIILEKEKIISDKSEINAIWHRVVHWWAFFSKPVLINESVIEKISECIELAPLHNPANLNWIIACRKIFWLVPQIACFDTWFHQTMEEEKYLYAIDLKYYEKYWIRKYWFHGISHEFVSKRAEEILWKEKTWKLITCHVGNWASISAIKNWKVVNTSMWFTPIDGLIMGTRSGNIDPSVLTFLMDKENLSTKEMNNILNKESGVLWLTWVSGDMRETEDWYLSKDEKFTLVMEMYISRIVQTIGQSIADLNWVDTIILTAGVLENSWVIRRLILERLWFIWVELDESINDFRWEERIISTKDSKVTVIVIPTNEEKMIAEATYNILK